MNGKGVANTPEPGGGGGGDGPPDSDHGSGRDSGRERPDFHGESRLSLREGPSRETTTISEKADRFDRPGMNSGEHLGADRPDRNDGPSIRSDTGKSRPYIENRLSSRVKVGASMGGNALAAFGLAAGIGGQVGGNASVVDGRGGLGAGLFVPISGIGLAVAKLGASFDLTIDGVDSTSPQTPSTVSCVRQVMIVAPIFSLTMQLPNEQSGAIGGATLSLGVTLGIGVFAGLYCGFEIKPGF
ncbi:hypothetical protein D3C87_497490 [compost metagenome]